MHYRIEGVMNKEILRGNWRRITGSVEHPSGRLPDEDLILVQGEFDRVLGVIQRRYGVGRAQASRELDDFLSRVAHEIEQTAGGILRQQPASRINVVVPMVAAPEERHTGGGRIDASSSPRSLRSMDQIGPCAPGELACGELRGAPHHGL